MVGRADRRPTNDTRKRIFSSLRLAQSTEWVAYNLAQRYNTSVISSKRHRRAGWREQRSRGQTDTSKPPIHQYSSGNRIVVMLRSASVISQILSPLLCV
jgi:hypothetical protein